MIEVQMVFKTPKWHNKYAKLHEWFDTHFRKNHYIKHMKEIFGEDGT
jgi:hypothetical protein